MKKPASADRDGGGIGYPTSPFGKWEYLGKRTGTFYDQSGRPIGRSSYGPVWWFVIPSPTGVPHHKRIGAYVTQRGPYAYELYIPGNGITETRTTRAEAMKIGMAVGTAEMEQTKWI